MTHHDYQIVLAHFALEDPKHTLENEIEFKRTKEQILRDRRANS